MRSRNFFTLMLILIHGGTAEAAEISYVVRNLGTFGGPWSWATNISSNGLISGTASDGTTNHAFIYDPSTGIMQDLGADSTAAAVNASGQATGSTNQFGGRAFLYQDGTMQPVPVLGSGLYADGRDINDSGQLVGGSQTAGTSYEQAFLYEGGQIRDLGTLNNTVLSSAYAISPNGLVTGWSRVDDNPSAPIVHAFLYRNGAMTDVGALMGGSAGSTYGYDVNDAGFVTGEAGVSSNLRHAFLYDGSRMIDLGILGINGNSTGLGINARGDVVGASQGRAFLYRNGAMLDLNSLVADFGGLAYLGSASAINDRGEIVGTGYIHVGQNCRPQPDGGQFCREVYQQRAFLATPVPLPSTLFLFGSGMALARAVGRKQKSV